MGFRRYLYRGKYSKQKMNTFMDGRGHLPGNVQNVPREFNQFVLFPK